MTDLFTPISDGEFNPFDDGTDVPRLVKGDGAKDENWGQIDDPASQKAKRKIVSHTARTTAWCEKQGYTSTAVEMKDLYVSGGQSFQGKKHDLLGLFDRLALDPRSLKTIGIQVVSTNLKSGKAAERNKHLRKMCSTDIESKSRKSFLSNLRLWLACGNRAIVLDWEQRPKVGNQEWFPVVFEITEEVIEMVLSRKRRAA